MRLITSKDNPNIKLFKKLTESKKCRRETGLFTLEGARLIVDAVRENAEIQSVFVTESFLEKQGGEIDFPDGVKVFAITDGLGKSISDTSGAQGIFAVCRAAEKPSFSQTVRRGGKYLLLCGLQDPGNLGTIIRTADAVGLDGVFLAGCCELYSPKTVRSTMGSLFRVNVWEVDFEEIFPLFEERGVPTYAAVVDADAVSLTECDFSGGGAVLIGNEGNGLPESAAERCTEKITVKMKGNVNSLNAAMAAGIIMWEMEK
ncbi:MAG: RNA methyltransferase [Ruminococcus sp.]|nr:RNA methyltransferase [Ruminococcus sp.]MCM1381235.1 RNA methyltransferase [Muribaculaceae bacterium]